MPPITGQPHIFGLLRCLPELATAGFPLLAAARGFGGEAGQALQAVQLVAALMGLVFLRLLSATTVVAFTGVFWAAGALVFGYVGARLLLVLLAFAFATGCFAPASS